MEAPGRRGVGAARGPAEMGAPDGGEASAEAGAARFQCPEDFCAPRFAPGAAFRPESLGAPGQRLLLISAPADFRPESLSGRRLALPASPVLRASQPDGSQKVYRLQAGREGSAARLLIAGPERLTCAQPFRASLRIQESHGAPGAAWALFPVAERPPPQLPQGLRQRFFPFGARLQRPRPPSEAAERAARKRGKKRPLQPLKQELWQLEGPAQLPGGFPEADGGLLGGRARAGSKRRPLKEEEEEEATEPARLPVLGGRLLWQDAHLQEGSWSPEVEEPGRRGAGKKREKKRKAGLQAEELQHPGSRYWQPEREPEGGGGDSAGEPAGCKAKKTKTTKKTMKQEAEGLWGAAAIKEEPVDVPCMGSPLEENRRAVGEEPVGDVSSCKRKKKRRRRKSRERLAGGLWGAAAIKEEPGDAPCLGSLPEGAPGSPRGEPDGELTGYIKQSPGKGAGGLWGVAALKEELGDLPSLGSLAGERLGVTPEDPTAELPSCKKKRKKKGRERMAEVQGGVAALKQELGDTSCLGSLLGEGPGSARGGPAGELPACKKKKGGKLDKEPLQEQGAETQLDWAAPLWQEAGTEEPSQMNEEAAPRPKKKKKKKGRRREGEDQAGT